MIREPLWGVDACRVDADLPRTPKRTTDVPATRLEQQIRDLVARQRAEQAATDRAATRWRAFLAPSDTPTDTAPEEAT